MSPHFLALTVLCSTPQALVLQDLKTEDPSQPGGYARRRVERGSVVLVRGADDEGTTVTWVAWVRKVGRQRGPMFLRSHAALLGSAWRGLPASVYRGILPSGADASPESCGPLGHGSRRLCCASAAVGIGPWHP